jgi:hypothetical protein
LKFTDCSVIKANLNELYNKIMDVIEDIISEILDIII